MLSVASVLVLALVFFGCVGAPTNPSPIPSPLPSALPSAVPTATPTLTPTPTATPVVSPSPTVSPTASPIASPTASPSPSPSVVPDARSLEGNRELARQFVLIESTFRNCGGMLDTLRLTGTFEQDCPYCWTFAFNYTATSNGYGSCALPALQDHSALIQMREGVVFSGVLDGKWDMIKQKMIG